MDLVTGWFGRIWIKKVVIGNAGKLYRNVEYRITNPEF